MHSLSKVLLVEDDRAIAGALSHALRTEYEIITANTGTLGLYKTELEDFDLIVLDLNLPDMSGKQICEQLRRRGITTPILILTGENRILTKITLLDAGANDYLTKPFSLGELKARLRALSRPGSSIQKPSVSLNASGLELNRQTYEVKYEGILISLRRKEFALLECLMEHAGKVVSRDLLTRSVWHGSDELWTNTVDVHIKYLRDKIDRPFGRSLIRTVHGRGYKLEHADALVTHEG